MIATQWPTKRLRDITSKIGSGATPRGGKESYLSSGISLIRSLNVYDFKFEKDDLAFISDEQAADLSNVVVQQDDILLNITGASVARCCLTDPRYLPARVNQHVAIVRVRPEVADARFVLYCINSLHFKSRLLALAQGGATREALTKTTIEDFEVLQPPLPIQRRIAGILSAYDELIENSQRRIKILESMARALYREWFVHFRFPGHESVPLVPSTLGEIPEGWEVGRLDDVLVLQRGFDLPKVNRVEGHVPIYAATGVTGFHNEAKAKAPGVVTGRSGTIGDVIYVQDDFWPLNTALWAKEFPKAKPLYAFYFLSSIDLKQFNSGAAVPTLNRNDIHGLDALIPPYPVQQKFQDVAGEMLEQARKLSLQLHNLRRTRDLLLPRLLSGQIDVDAMPA